MIPELEEKTRENEPGKGWVFVLLMMGAGIWLIILKYIICKNM